MGDPCKDKVNADLHSHASILDDCKIQNFLSCHPNTISQPSNNQQQLQVQPQGPSYLELLAASKVDTMRALLNQHILQSLQASSSIPSSMTAAEGISQVVAAAQPSTTLGCPPFATSSSSSSPQPPPPSSSQGVNILTLLLALQNNQLAPQNLLLAQAFELQLQQEQLQQEQQRQQQQQQQAQPPHVEIKQRQILALVSQKANKVGSEEAAAAVVVDNSINEEYGPNDVLFGHGKVKQNGNIVLMKLIGSLSETYDNSRYKDKVILSDTVVQAIKDKGGRFLKYNSGRWEEASNNEAHDKIAHAFRNHRRRKALRAKKSR